MLEVRLQNIGAAGREPCGTIGQVVTPHATESLVETESGNLIGHLVEAAEPRLQGMRIVQAEAVELGDLEPGPAALLAEPLRRQQHAAREDVGLNEVGTPAIGLEE